MKKVETQQPIIKIPEEITNTRRIKSDTKTTRKHTLKNNNALEETFGSNIKFPFKWTYGRIKELSDVEKDELNRVKHHSRRRYQKPCALCGEEGIIKYKKISNNNNSFICETCAKKYVLSAMKIMERETEVKNE